MTTTDHYGVFFSFSFSLEQNKKLIIGMWARQKHFLLVLLNGLEHQKRKKVHHAPRDRYIFLSDGCRGHGIHLNCQLSHLFNSYQFHYSLHFPLFFLVCWIFPFNSLRIISLLGELIHVRAAGWRAPKRGRSWGRGFMVFFFRCCCFRWHSPRQRTNQRRVSCIFFSVSPPLEHATAANHPTTRGSNRSRNKNPHLLLT